MHCIKNLSAVVLFLVLPFMAISQNFGGNVPSVKWYQVNTPKAKVIFPAGLDSQANRIANEVMLMDSETSATIGGHQRKWNIVLQTQTTIPNAYVRMAPLLSELNMIPGQDNFSTGSIRWDDNLVTHETRHMQQFSNFNKGLSKVFSIFLGQDGQLFANGLLLPDYFFEGDAVWQETLVSAQGRGRMPSFLNGFKALWLEKKKYPWMKYRSGSLKDFVPDHYPIGYVLVGYGYEKYGQQFWNKVTQDAVRFKSLFNKAVGNHAGISFMQFKDDAIASFKQKTLAGETEPGAIPKYITGVQKNNVVDYMFPNVLDDGSIIVTKKSYKSLAAFYMLKNGHEKKIVVKKPVLDDYYSTNGRQIVYASFQTDPRWANRDYSVLQLVDVATGQQKQITFRSKYFSPNINKKGDVILSVDVHQDGTNQLVQIQTSTGEVLHRTPNAENYFYTQTQFIDDANAVAAVRNPGGEMALVKVNLDNGLTETITPFSFNVLGYPYIQGDTVYYSRMDDRADNVYAVVLGSKKIFRVTHFINGVYHPVRNNKNELLFSAFTAEGYRIGTAAIPTANWKEVEENKTVTAQAAATANALQKEGAGALYRLTDKKNTVTRYRKSFQLFNFHSWRPVVNDPEYGYSVYGDNILTNFSNILSYTYNYSDRSHTVTLDEVYSGWFPRLTLSLENSFNRTIDTAVGKPFQYNAATVKGGVDIPLQFIGGRTSQYLDFGASYNLEQYYYRGATKNVFTNKAIDYVNTFLSFSNVSQQAKQHINPRWAQAVSLSYRDAFTYRDSHKFVGSAALYFPGLGVNHSLVLNAAVQQRDTLADLFSNNFPYARGYQALSTRQMYKWGLNYHLPLWYPDGGIGGLVYFLRIRANAFYDYNNAKARLNGTLTNIINRSAGGEIYFDTKVWNSLPVTIGVRCSHLLDTDLLNPTVKNRWEIILPIGIIPD